MGTADNEIGRLQKEFRRELARAGLSLMQFAEYYLADDDEADKAKISRFADTLKRQLNRSSTSESMRAKLEGYLKKLHDHEVYRRRIGQVMPRNIPYPEVDENFRREMKKVARQIDELIEAEIEPPE